jgi:uncharacterized protein YlzI (FlbEa/FlbD family)
MFFVRGLTLNGKEILVNPDQVLCVYSVNRFRRKTALLLTNGKCLVIDQSTRTVSERFEDYLRGIVENSDNDSETAKCQCDTKLGITP